MPNPVDLEPQAKAVVDANADPPFLFELGPEQGRRIIDAVQSGPVKKPTVDIEDTTVPGGPSGQVSVRILRPQSTRRPLAVIVYLHGAGWVFGNYHTHDRLIRELAVGAQAAVVFPNYSLAPEAKYPTAIQECDAVAARPMPTSSATLASLSPPTASRPSSTTSSCSTPSPTPTPPGVPSPWPPTPCERCCPTRPEAPAGSALATVATSLHLGCEAVRECVFALL
jgi:hypothetical protein